MYNDTLVHAMKVCGWRGSIVPDILSTGIYVYILLVFALSVLKTLEHFFMGPVHDNVCYNYVSKLHDFGFIM